MTPHVFPLRLRNLLICVKRCYTHVQIRCPRERFRAKFALVRLDSVMSSHMHQKVIVPNETLATFGAQKALPILMFLLCVLAIQLAIGELCVTVLTVEYLRLKVPSSMVLQTLRRGEALLTNVANFGLFRRFLVAVL